MSGSPLAHATVFDQAAPHQLSWGRDQATLWCGGGQNGLQARIGARAETLEGLYKVEMHTVHGSRGGVLYFYDGKMMGGSSAFAFIGTYTENHIIVLGEMHLRRVVKSYADYYDNVRTHRSLNKDAPVSRPVQRRGVISSRAILGGLHHHYARV
jgi:hypothetical protein